MTPVGVGLPPGRSAQGFAARAAIAFLAYAQTRRGWPASKACLAQLAQVLRDRRLAEGQSRDELADARLA